MLDLSVVVPVRNAEQWVDACLTSIVREQPREIFVIDGQSTDRTREIAGRYPVTILSDDGKGLPVARRIGAEAASSRLVALIDCDVVLHEGALASLMDEYKREGYIGLQAGLRSVSGPGYWGQALVRHHRTGRSKHWFGVVATICDRQVLLEHGFDERFLSGEDIDLRWRLERAGAKVGVSRETIVEHRFDDTFEFAKRQWHADGQGLGRMMRVHRLRAALLAGLPLSAAARGVILSLVRLEPKWIPYYLCFLWGNYRGMIQGRFGARGDAGEPPSP